MKRMILGLAVAAVAATALPASAHVTYEYCWQGTFVRYICGVCVEEGRLSTCTPTK